MFLLVDLCCLKMVWICNEGSFYELKVVVKVVVKFVLKVVVKVVLKFVVIVVVKVVVRVVVIVVVK